LKPSRWYAGNPTNVVRLEVPSDDYQRLLGAPDLREGQRYLVAANDGRLMVCGFSGPYVEERAALYTQAFG
jgi:hypothetical protein